TPRASGSAPRPPTCTPGDSARRGRRKARRTWAGRPRRGLGAAERAVVPARAAPGLGVERVTAVDDVARRDDGAEILGIELDELLPLGEQQHDIGVPCGLAGAVRVTEIGVRRT